MNIIPVIDLMNGLAVHAWQGRREHYRPLQTRLAPSPEPEAVIAGLLRLHSFATVYLADLDALMGKAPQMALIARLGQAFPGLRLWVDRGWPEPIAMPAAAVTTVVGSESLNPERLEHLDNMARPFILSLDFRDRRLLGPPELLQRPELWPEDIILMDLDQVGCARGPDWARVERFRRRFPERRFIAAGGVRNEADLQRLEALGVAAVLIATALHSGALEAGLLARYG